MRDLSAHFSADEQPILFHATEMLIEHLFGNGPHPPFEFSDPDRTLLKLVENCDFPLPLNQREHSLDYLFIRCLDSR
jgi:hypothetical protein